MSSLSSLLDCFGDGVSAGSMSDVRFRFLLRAALAAFVGRAASVGLSFSMSGFLSAKPLAVLRVARAIGQGWVEKVGGHAEDGAVVSSDALSPTALRGDEFSQKWRCDDDTDGDEEDA